MSKKGHKAGFAALVGAPNAGKSTLLNAMLRFPLSIVSPKPQTTRHKLLGILNGEGYQACLLDTPGWLTRTQDRLQDALVRSVKAAADQDADLIVLVIDGADAKPVAGAPAPLSRAAESGTPVLLAVNKMDLVKDKAAARARVEAFERSFPVAQTRYLSALKGDGVKGLVDGIVSALPESPPYYSPEQLSDRWERFFAAELIRAEIFRLFEQEVPHACAVIIDSFKESKAGKDKVAATIYVERPPHKGIILGKKGRAIKELRESGQKSISEFTGRKTELELWVKVRKNWRKDRAALKEFGY